MTLLDQLKDKETWERFFADRLARNLFSKAEQKELAYFIDHQKYQEMDPFSFGYPRKIIVSKIESDKKRTVYSYTRYENYVLSLLAYLLRKYDDRLSESCFSFRTDYTAKKAFEQIRRISNLESRYVLKVDIHDYFNSIDVDQLLMILPEIIDDDPRLLDFMEYLLRQDHCRYHDQVIEEKRGAMAGVPIANFFANVYLLSLDSMFNEKGIRYFRYSDDIIMFLKDEQELVDCRKLLEEEIRKKKLTFNPDKLLIAKPGEPWEFLGFVYRDGEIDLADIAIRKMKGKISRKARKIRRWQTRKKASFEKAAKAMIRDFDNRFYDLKGDGSFCWTRFYFPVITTDKGLKIIDEYMLENLRFLYSGRHYKGNYKVSYEELKELGYTPLVSEYYRFRKQRVELLAEYR